MSTWAHVVGCIRIDGIKELGASLEKLEKTLGPMCTWENWNDNSTLPRGSEGGLQYRVIEYNNGMPWVAVPVWGDLRDYETPDGIVAWWKNILPKLGIVRDAILQITINGISTTVTENDAV